MGGRRPSRRSSASTSSTSMCTAAPLSTATIRKAALSKGDNDLTSRGLAIAKMLLRAAQAIEDGNAPVPVMEFDLIE